MSELPSFIQYLEKNLEESPPAKKGACTRESIKIATAKMLEKHGYHEMRVKDITRCAGIAEGSFYIYFNDKKDVSLMTLSSFFIDFVDKFANRIEFICCNDAIFEHIADQVQKIVDITVFELLL